MTFLGIMVDTVLFQLRLAPEKVTWLKMEWSRRRSCTCRELESFVGHLAHAATVIHPGRIFLRQLFCLLAGVHQPHHFVCLSSAIHADLQWWSHFLQVWNGTSFFPPPTPSSHVYSDASGSYGCGAFVASCGWFKVQWPASWSDMAIAQKELVPVVMAPAVWGHQWQGCHVCFYSDNMAVVSVLVNRAANETPAPHPVFLCSLL